VAASIGSIVSTGLLFPLDLAKTHLVTQSRTRATPGHPRENTVMILARLLREGGPLALYTGILSKTCHAVAQSFTYFYMYSATKNFMSGRAGGRELTTLENLVAGYVSAVLNLGTTLPLEVRGTRGVRVLCVTVGGHVRVLCATVGGHVRVLCFSLLARTWCACVLDR
jgi:hypothetical protein